MAKIKMLFGKAPLTVCRTSTSYVQVYAGAPVPEDITDDDRDRLIGEGYLEEREVDDPADTAAGDGKPARVEDILAAVGDDKAKAAEALAQEQQAAKPRAGLVKKLQAVVDA